MECPWAKSILKLFSGQQRVMLYWADPSKESKAGCFCCFSQPDIPQINRLKMAEWQISDWTSQFDFISNTRWQNTFNSHGRVGRRVESRHPVLWNTSRVCRLGFSVYHRVTVAAQTEQASHRILGNLAGNEHSDSVAQDLSYLAVEGIHTHMQANTHTRPHTITIIQVSINLQTHLCGILHLLQFFHGPTSWQRPT